MSQSDRFSVITKARGWTDTLERYFLFNISGLSRFEPLRQNVISKVESNRCRRSGQAARIRSAVDEINAVAACFEGAGIANLRRWRCEDFNLVFQHRMSEAVISAGLIPDQACFANYYQTEFPTLTAFFNDFVETCALSFTAWATQLFRQSIKPITTDEKHIEQRIDLRGLKSLSCRVWSDRETLDVTNAIRLMPGIRQEFAAFRVHLESGNGIAEEIVAVIDRISEDHPLRKLQQGAGAFADEERSFRTIETKADGPHEPDEFWWKGRMVAGMKGKKMALVRLSYERWVDQAPISVEEAGQCFWKDSYDPRHNLDQTKSEIRKRLEPLGATLATVNGKLVFKENVN